MFPIDLNFCHRPKISQYHSQLSGLKFPKIHILRRNPPFFVLNGQLIILKMHSQVHKISYLLEVKHPLNLFFQSTFETLYSHLYKMYHLNHYFQMAVEENQLNL